MYFQVAGSIGVYDSGLASGTPLNLGNIVDNEEIYKLSLSIFFFPVSSYGTKSVIMDVALCFSDQLTGQIGRSWQNFFFPDIVRRKECLSRLVCRIVLF